ADPHRQRIDGGECGDVRGCRRSDRRDVAEDEWCGRREARESAGTGVQGAAHVAPPSRYFTASRISSNCRALIFVTCALTESAYTAGGRARAARAASRAARNSRRCTAFTGAPLVTVE